jgi:hypothetical protein
MPDEAAKPVVFSSAIATRIGNVVKEVENWKGDRTGRPHVYHDTGDETLWAKLTFKGTEGFSWQEVRRHKGTGDTAPKWETWPNARTSRASATDGKPKLLAIELVPGTGRVGDVVLLRQIVKKMDAASAGDPAEYQPEFVIVAPLTDPWLTLSGHDGCGAGVYKATVFRPIDSPMDPTGSLGVISIGTSDADVVYAVNVREIGWGTWDLDANPIYMPQLFRGTFWHRNDDGTCIYLIDGAQWRTCGT